MVLNTHSDAITLIHLWQNIDENVADGIKEEYDGPLEDSNVSVCLEEDSYDPLEAIPEDNPPENADRPRNGS